MADRVPERSRAPAAPPCVAVKAAEASFTLYPPTPFAIDESTARYKLVVPFGRASVDLALDGGACIRRQLRPGDLVVAQPGSRLWIRHVEPLEFLLVLVEPDAVRQAASAAAGEGWRVPDSAPWHDAAVAALGQEMRRVLIADPMPATGYLLALSAALVAPLALAAGGGGRREPMAPAALARVLRHVEDRLAEPIEVAELARVAGLSHAHFARVFARATGDTPHRFVMKRRVCRARDLLSAGEATLAEVAVRAGFGNQSHMSTAFAREVGLSSARYGAAFRHAEPTAPVRRDGASPGEYRRERWP